MFRTTAIRALSERLTQTIASANEQAARETDQLFEEQAELGRRKQQLDRGLQEAQVGQSQNWRHQTKSAAFEHQIRRMQMGELPNNSLGSSFTVTTGCGRKQ